MEPGSQTNQLPEVRSGVDELASQIRKYLSALERLTWSNQVEYDRLKHLGDELEMAKVKSYLTKVEHHIRSMTKSLYETTMNELGKDGSTDLQQSLISLATELKKLEQPHGDSEAKNKEIA